MIITVSGTPGAGKSSVADILAKDLGMKRYSVGDLRGKMAQEKGMTIDEFNKLGETEEFTDKDADAYQERLGKEEDGFVIDSRLGFHFIPHSFKIFLKCDEEIGAQRIFNDQDNRSDEKTYATVNETLLAIKERMDSDRRRYQRYYRINPFMDGLYNLIIDTTDMAVSEVVDRILPEIPSSEDQAKPL